MADSDANNNNIPLRENLVNTAAKFLQNPKVLASPLKQKQEFLKRKGLTEEEIQRACELSSTNINYDHISRSQNEFTAISIPYAQRYPPYHGLQPVQPTFFQKVKEFLNATALIGATLYGIYWLYKRFIEPFLFGRKKRKTVEDSVTDLDKTIQDSMKSMKDSISKVEDDVSKLTQSRSSDLTIPQLVQEVKQDLASLKAMLLSRKQFPSTPPTIPSWQLDTSTRNQEKTTEREDDAGSGSSTNNSDSSLEMIREDPPKE
ncbi:peroxisomal membrane protein PEX14 [Orussus abietinus]|uniref:peroxisomal membrane protein PEX14 n=1 Tax=Orussus abietinus TaxID=222816 RepID=UPI0006264F02|nr:peroxisomal membrane protein PEX14 [Orussus abietinus]